MRKLDLEAQMLSELCLGEGLVIGDPWVVGGTYMNGHGRWVFCFHITIVFS